MFSETIPSYSLRLLIITNTPKFHSPMPCSSYEGRYETRKQHSVYLKSPLELVTTVPT